MRRLLLPILLVALIAALPLTAMATAEEDANRALVRRWVDEVLSGENFAVAAELTTPDFVSHNYLSGDQTAAEVVASMQEIIASSPDAYVYANTYVADGDYVAVLWVEGGTSTYEWQGLQPTGEPWFLSGVALNRIENGKLAEQWVVFDTALLMQQLNVIPVESRDHFRAVEWPALDTTTELTHEEARRLNEIGAEMWNSGDVSLFPAVNADNIRFHMPLSMNPVPLDTEGIVAQIGMVRAAMPDFLIRLYADSFKPNFLVEGNLIVEMLVLEGTFTNDMGDMKANGAKISCPGINVFRVENGRVAEVWDNYDTLCFMQAMMAPPAE